MPNLIKKNFLALTKRTGLTKFVEFVSFFTPTTPTFKNYVELTYGGLRFYYAIMLLKRFPNYFYDNYQFKKYSFQKNSDFGELHDKGEQNLVTMTSVEELEALLKKSNREKIKIHLCGSAHSSNGSTLAAKGGLRVLIKNIPATYKMLGDEIVEASAFGTIRQLAKFLAQYERILPVVGDQFGLTLGGYLSAGGIGYGSIQNGMLAEHVLKVHLLTAQGEKISCSPDEHPEIFYSVLGGGGQLGVILAVQIKTIPRKHFFSV